MSYQITMKKKGDILHALIKDTRTRQTVLAAAEEILQACTEKKCPKLLVDVREMEGRLSIIDAYQLAATDFTQFRGKGIKQMAIVDWPMSGGRRWFLETVMQNRGYHIQMFEDADEAMGWLQENTESPGGKKE